MKTFNFLILSVLLFNFNTSFASDALDSKTDSLDGEMTWVGEIKDDPRTHTTEHRHALEFVRDVDGDSFDIVDSPELTRLHHETGKNYRIEAKVAKTPKFLFFGGNLVVKSFKVIEETSDSIPHALPRRESAPVRMRTISGRNL